MSSAGNPVDPDAVERAVEMVRDAVRASEIYGQQLAAIGNEHGKLLCTAAARAAELERELARARRLQPLDQDGQPITQAAANRLMSTYYSDVPQLRTERDAALARVAELQGEIQLWTKRTHRTEDERNALRSKLESAKTDLHEMREVAEFRAEQVRNREREAASYGEQIHALNRIAGELRTRLAAAEGALREISQCENCGPCQATAAAVAGREGE